MTEEDVDASDIAYSFRPSLGRPAWEFRLAPDALEWESGRRSGRIPYRAIRRLRLSYRPVTLQTQRYMAEIWPQDGGKLPLLSVSTKSFVETVRQDRDYADFIRALHARIAAAGGGAVLERGVPALQYWIGLVVFAAVALALALMTVRGLQEGFWSGAAFVAAFFALFLWQIGNYFRRNRPGRYAADALPADLLP